MRGLALGSVLVSCFLLLAVRSSAGADPVAAAAGMRLTTLYRLDPLRSVISLATGENGHEIQDFYVANRGSDIDFGNYGADALTVAIEESRLGSIVDLGTADDLARRYGYKESVGGGQGFASLHLDSGRLVVTTAARGTFQALQEGKLLSQRVASNTAAPAVLGHIYLVRIIDPRDHAFERIAKILVVAHVPNESVSIRWAPL